MLKKSRSMIPVLIISTLIGISRTSWVIVWICLEVNTLAMCWVLSKESKNLKYRGNTTITYYLVQVITSIVILSLSNQEERMMRSTLIVIAILAKIGAWPIHLWYIKIIDSIEIEQKSMLIVITWQKILPIILVVSINLGAYIIIILTTLRLATLIVPLVKLSKKSSVKRIIALSSLNNNAWLIISIIASLKCFRIFLTLYSTTLAITLKSLRKITTKIITINLTFWSSLLVIGNMGGLPPLTIFWSKVIVLKITILRQVSTELALILIISACYILYHYLWIGNYETSKKPNKQQLAIKPESTNKLIWWVRISRIVGLLALTSLGSP